MTNALHAEVAVRIGLLDLDVVLDVGPGEAVSVVGPNGAGKTTLLRAIAGLQPIDRGRVVVDGVDITATAIERRRIGVVFQDHVLFPHLSALDNVAFGPRSTGVRRGDARRRAREWLARVGLDDHGDHRPDQLSGGQSQRVALARALATEPRLLLLDEPLAALDASTRTDTRRALRRDLAASGVARVLVTHDPVDAAALADRIVVLEAGRVVQQGAPADIAARPRSRYVADLVGVNLLRGTGQAGHLVLDGGAALVVPDADAGDVLAVVHPRSVSLFRERPEGTPRNVWQGTITSVDDEGDRVRVDVAGAVPIVAEVTPAAVRDLALAPGAAVWVSVKATEIAAYPA
ncbi:MAG TPA: ABC transporter ATP-binding protein [Acidimicrobiales bacterium]|nr:ABC transporter ATP-binding protein [Acidimicrobiales bacterium]